MNSVLKSYYAYPPGPPTHQPSFHISVGEDNTNYFSRFVSSIKEDGFQALTSPFPKKTLVHRNRVLCVCLCLTSLFLSLVRHGTILVNSSCRFFPFFRSGDCAAYIGGGGGGGGGESYKLRRLVQRGSDGGLGVAMYYLQSHGRAPGWGTIQSTYDLLGL